MTVLKFGGSSLKDAYWIDQALTITERQLDRSPVLVASAMGDTTDRLSRIADHTAAGEFDQASALLEDMRAYHDGTAGTLLSGRALEHARIRLDALFHEICSLVKGLSLLRECTPRSRDALLAFGELLSSGIITARAQERGMSVQLLDSREFIKTDSSFTGAIPIFHITNRLVREMVMPRKGSLVILQGFIASTGTGVTTTIGRGGADYTAAIVGSALGADEIQIWTDVDGIMTADPRVVPEAISIPEIGYEEAAELAYFGAKVVHPSTIQPAVALGIPVRVRNTGNPVNPGTTILPEARGTGIRALAGKKGITMVAVTSSRMLNAYGFLSRIFAIFEKHRTPVDLVATSEVSVSMTIENDRDLEAIQQDLSEIGTVTVFRNKSIICLVGRELWKDPSFIARVFHALTSTPIRMISLGSSDINLSIVVFESMLDEAIRKLHREFFS